MSHTPAEPTRIHAVLDANVLKAAHALKATAHVAEVYAPGIVVQERLRQLIQGRRAHAVRADFRSLSRADGVVLPDLLGCARASFGLTTGWAEEGRQWRSLIEMTSNGAAAEAVRESWETMRREGLVTFGSEGFFWMKGMSGAYRNAQERINIKLSREHGPFTDPAARSAALVGGKLSFLLQMALLAEVPAVVDLVDVPGIDEDLDQLESMTVPPETRMALQTSYRGGLELSGSLYAWLTLEGLNNRHPGKNDMFDVAITAAVGDDQSWVFVTEEKKWRRAARAIGLGPRVISLQNALAGPSRAELP